MSEVGEHVVQILRDRLLVARRNVRFQTTSLQQQISKEKDAHRKVETAKDDLNSAVEQVLQIEEAMRAMSIPIPFEDE